MDVCNSFGGGKLHWLSSIMRIRQTSSRKCNLLLLKEEAKQALFVYVAVAGNRDQGRRH